MCSFNPVYGQGMTVAAQEASLLQACLRCGDADLAQRFFNAAKAAIDVPWNIAVGNDLRHPQVQGPRSPKVRFARVQARQDRWRMQARVLSFVMAKFVMARLVLAMTNSNGAMLPSQHL
ncbi:hypothetical protein [Bradyrhizobium sp.]